MSSIEDISQRVRIIQQTQARQDEQLRRAGKDIGEIKDAVVQLTEVQIQSASCKAVQDQRWIAHNKEHDDLKEELRELAKISRGNRAQMAVIGLASGFAGTIVGTVISLAIMKLLEGMF